MTASPAAWKPAPARGFFALALALTCLAALPACGPKETGTILPGPPEQGKNYDRPLPPGASALVKITDPAMIPDFTPACRDRRGLAVAVARSLNYLSKPSSRTFFPVADISHQRVVATLEDFRELLARDLPAEAMAEEIRRRYDVYMSIGCDDRGTVLYTGYYTPIFRASPKRTAEFRYPLYRQPDDLVKAKDGRILGRQTPDGRIVKYPPRKLIEQSDHLAGQELVYLADRFDVYIAHVQGSARLRMPDGEVITVGYAANNGWEYNSVGRELVRDGKVPASGLSLQAMREHFRKHPEQIEDYTWRNPRFVFFTASQGAPRGSLNEPVTPWRSIATDKAIFPRAALTMIDTPLPQIQGRTVGLAPYRGLALDQDTGGAIRAPGRCDVYIGEGAAAGELAGRTYQEGKLYYLFIKE